MEQSLPEINHCAPINSDIRKPSNTISWLGFSFSLFVLLLLWLTLIKSVVIISNSNDTYSGALPVILMLVSLIGMPLGIAGLLLSIIGIIKASNSGGKKWIGTCGVFFTGLSILSIFAPFFLSPLIVKEPTTVITSTSLENTNQLEHDVVFIIEGYRLKCFDNRETADVNPYETRLEYPTQIRKELEIWFKMHNIPKNEPIKLKVSQDTNYTQVSDLLEALKRLGVTKYQLVTISKNTRH